MGFMLCDLHVSLNNPSSGDINSSNLPCFYFFSLYYSMENVITLEAKWNKHFVMKMKSIIHSSLARMKQK